MANASTVEKPEDVIALMRDREWRLNNLYTILDADGKKVKFKLNWAQKKLFSELHFFNVILKARQLGFSTFILIYILDCCLFTPNIAAGVIAQSLVAASDLFNNKVKFAYDNLPDHIKAILPTVRDSAGKITFSNGSSITVGTSLRGGTFQILHVSEYGKIAARFPEKAREIKTGALNTIHAGQQIFIESTAEGRDGEFYILCEIARRLKEQGSKLTPLDPKFHFFPWWANPDYSLDDRVLITSEDTAYFDKLEGLGIKLGADQRAWYVKKSAIQGDDMKREFPSSPEEAFEASVEGAYYSRAMATVRKQGQICRVLHDPKYPVNTFWDIGNHDYMAVWYHQYVLREHRFIRYYQNANEDLSHYAQELRSHGYTFGNHYLPHDGGTVRLGLKNQSTRDILMSLGIKPILIVPRTQDVVDDIRKCQSKIPECWFDEVNCTEGIKCLDNYRKEWDDRLGVWKDRPRHDEFSHGADGFRTFVMGYHEENSKPSVEDDIPERWEDW